MIKKYSDGADFLAENAEMLEKNTYATAFFFIDAKIFSEPSENNYALRAESDGGALLAIRIAPYSLLLYGEPGLVPEALDFLSREGYNYESINCLLELGERLPSGFTLSMGMDFMEATEITEPSCPEVETPGEGDVEELYECFVNFCADCGLPDKPERERIRKRLPDVRCLRRDGKIVSLAMINPDTERSRRLSYVYTRPEYRGTGLARKVVNFAKNEIISQGLAATLNVDRKNPVSNHLYESLGFRKLFSQGVYNVKK